MIRPIAKRTAIFLAGLTAALALPAAASAHCGSTQGSYAVTCENGVQVYRHNAPSSLPRGLSPAQAKLKAAKIKQQTQLARIAASERAQAASNELRARELDIKDYRARVADRNARRRSYVYGGGYGFQRGFTFGRTVPVKARPRPRTRAKH